MYFTWTIICSMVIYIYIFCCFVYENDIVLSIVHTLICLVSTLYVHELLTEQIKVWTMDRTISFSYTKQQKIYIYIYHHRTNNCSCKVHYSIVHTLICLVNNSWTYNVLYMNKYLFFLWWYIYIFFVALYMKMILSCPLLSFSYTKQQKIYIYITIEQIIVHVKYIICPWVIN
jgi:hypothetical protein